MIKIFKIIHKLIKKCGGNISLGRYTYFFLSKILRTGLTDVINNELKKKDIFLDVGANIGYYTILASKIVGEEGKVFAFEPDLTNYTKLKKSIAYNNCTNVFIENKAISDKNRLLNLFISSDNASDHRTYNIKGRDSVEISAVSIDSYAQSKSLKRLDFIKIDVQGYEPIVLKGMEKTLIKNKNIKLITEFWPYGIRNAGYEPIKYLNDLSKKGFSFFLVMEHNKFTKEISIKDAIRLCPNKKSIDLLCKR